MRQLRKSAGYIIVVLILLSLNVSPAFGKTLDERLDDIDDQVWIIAADGKIMRFGNLNMRDQGISNISIQIMHNGVVHRNYYIQKRAEGESATIHEGIPSNYPSNHVWVFRPTVKQAEKALLIYKSHKVTPWNIFKSTWLIKSIENEDVPSVTEIIDNVREPTWNKITNHLPNPGNLQNLLNWIVNILS
ncbi:MAG: hypothetical protein P1P80_04460 [ANME-2 cluster archaeon]|nr:hypothetical protein [ANME-2 cluster archaeon]